MKILKTLVKLIPIKTAYAHCDIPCGIYDPHMARLSAKTVLKMVQKLKELPQEDKNNLVRMIMVKEEHAELCKKETLILWTDYFKPEHLEKFPDLHALIWKAAKLCSENKRAIDEVKATELIETVNTIADIFEQTKKSS